MASILAIVSKKVFDRDFRAGLGETVPTTTYASAHPALAKLADGGDLFLVTVAPGESLWLAAVLARPKFQKDKWVAKANTSPIRDITAVIPKLAFENGKGLTARAGALAMSLQTPRTLSDADVALLGAMTNGKAPKPARATKSTTAKQAAAMSVVAKPIARITVAPKGASHLARAQEYLDGGALVEALDELLEAWASSKAAEIADAIDALGAHLARALPAIATKKTVIDGAWRDVGDQLQPADVPRLLAAFEHGSSGQVEGWLEILDRFPLDPRICAVAIDTTIQFVASSAGPSRTRANRLAEKIADGRCLPQIDKLIAKKLDAWNATELRDRLRKLKTKFAPPPPLAKEDKATVAALAKTIAKLAKGPVPDAVAVTRKAKRGADTDGDRLLAEVLADPANDAPRLVYADWLQEHDDPRGELITLQLLPTPTAAQHERIAQLVKQHGKRWLGPLAAVVSKPVFERGFLAGCTVELKTDKHHELLAHPLWATVNRVSCDDPVIAESPAMKSLRVVAGLSLVDYIELSRRTEPLPIEVAESIRLEHDDDDDKRPAIPKQWETLSQLGALAKLHEVGVLLDTSKGSSGFEAWNWLLGGKLGKQLTRLSLEFTDDMPSVRDCLAAFEVTKSLRTLRLMSCAYSVVEAVIRRDGKRFAYGLELVRPFDGEHLYHDVPDAVPALFEGLPKQPLLDVVVKGRTTKAQLATVETTLAELVGKRFERITVLASRS